jgi:hypothetical protein
MATSAPASEQVLACLFASDPQVIVECLPGGGPFGRGSPCMSHLGRPADAAKTAVVVSGGSTRLGPIESLRTIAEKIPEFESLNSNP